MSDSISRGATSWYLVQSMPRQEFRALSNLENQRYSCFLPTLKIEKVRRGRSEIVLEPLFSRYLFIQLDTVSSNWGRLHSTRGVAKLVAFGGRFATISESVIGGLRQARLPIAAPLFEAGDKVAIKSGAFTGIEGIFHMSDGKARACVLIELISRPQILTFELDVLRKTA